MRKVIVLLAVFSIVLVMVLGGLPVKAQAAASVRYMGVESITYEPDYPFRPAPAPVTPCTHFTYTFAMWKVNQWADRAYFTAYVEREGKNYVVANWSVGFSVTGGLQGIYWDYSTDCLTVHTIMAEFPYAKETRDNPIDGEQEYRLCRMHFYFKGELFVGEHVTIAGDYMISPTVADAVKASSFFGIANAETTNTGDEREYLILDTNPEGFTFADITETPITHEIPEVPYGPILALVACTTGLITSLKLRGLRKTELNVPTSLL